MLLNVSNCYTKDEGQTFTAILKGHTEAHINDDGLPVAGRQISFRIKLSQMITIGSDVKINLDNYDVSFSTQEKDGEQIVYKWLNPKKK